MFDWNDEELSNIIWGEDGKSQDHIVPYPEAKEDNNPLGYGDDIKKQPNQESLATKSTEQKETTSVIDLGGGKQECTPQYDKNNGFPATEFSMDSWPDQESLGTEMADNMSKVSGHDTTIDEKAALLDNTSEIFESRLDDSEQGDFVDYSWASLGSFEDLDRIFSNEDTLYGHGSLGNPDELWSPSKDVVSSPERSIPPSGDSPHLAFSMQKRSAEQFEGQEECLSDQNQSFTSGYENMNLMASDIPLDVKSCPPNIKYPGSNGNLLFKEKTALKIGGSNPSYSLDLDTGNVAVTNQCMDKENRQRKLVKGRKKLEVKSETRHLQNMQAWTQSGNQFLQFDSPYVANVGQARSSLVLGRQGQLQGTESAQYNHFSNPPLLSFVHGNIMKHSTTKPIMPHFHSIEQPAFSSYEVSPVNLNPLDHSTKVPIKSLIMTPQEKIEKLRRRQQMRAMLAIQKQQQQLGNQVSSTEYSVTEEHNDAEENLSIFPSLDPSSPVEQDDSTTISTAYDDCPVQDFILYQLQDIVGKLDLRVRLYIRDSLYRLAQSASQRQYASDTSSSNRGGRDDIARKEEINSQNRFPKTSEAEIETNPIDRTVAHLLFHKRLESSGKLVETPNSPLSTKLKAPSSMNFLTKSLSQRSENKQMLPHEVPELPCLYAKQDQLGTTTSFGASENAAKMPIMGTNRSRTPCD